MCHQCMPKMIRRMNSLDSPPMWDVVERQQSEAHDTFLMDLCSTHNQVWMVHKKSFCYAYLWHPFVFLHFLFWVFLWLDYFPTQQHTCMTGVRECCSFSIIFSFLSSKLLFCLFSIDAQIHSWKVFLHPFEQKICWCFFKRSWIFHNQNSSFLFSFMHAFICFHDLCYVLNSSDFVGIKFDCSFK